MAEYQQGEHSFNEDLLISGEELRGYAASQDLARGEPVEITGNYEVGPATDGGPFVGIILYDVSQGEEVAIAGDDCEVHLEVSEAINAGDALTPDGAGAFRQATTADIDFTAETYTPPDDANAVANEDIGAGDWGQAYISATSGVKV